jgi:adenine-specific DNA-methyltransferase
VRPWNTFAEGDNLEVVPRLVAEYGAVDLVYADPPYNTGNDFAYADDIRGDGVRNRRGWRGCGRGSRSCAVR